MRTADRIGIDLGGTKTRVVRVAGDGTVINSATRHTAEYGTGIAAAIALAFDIRNLTPGEDPGFIGVGASGPVLPDGTIANPDTLPGFSGFNLAEHLRAALNAPCRVDNDALTAALGEYRFGAGRGAHRLLMVTLGTGIGVAVINAGEPYRGTDGVTPEAGHIPVAGADSPCYCGLTNCWEQLASRTALQRLALAAVPSQIAAEGPQAAVAHLASDPERTDVFSEFAQRVAAGLSTLLTVHRPDVVVFGGSAAEYFHLLDPGLEAMLTHRPAYYAPIALRAAALGDLSGALGAACLSDNQH
jgi:Transcriptional regulator/sugar kinase